MENVSKHYIKNKQQNRGVVIDGQFITNKELILSDIINSILPKCDNAYFLVGYFYFSGFAELCDKLKDVNLKVLVGLEVERNIVNSIKEVENFATTNKTRGQLREDFYKSLVEIFKTTIYNFLQFSLIQFPFSVYYN